MYNRKRKGFRSNNADMKVAEQCGIAVSKGNQILGIQGKS